jgi:hypothetical protein
VSARECEYADPAQGGGAYTLAPHPADHRMAVRLPGGGAAYMDLCGHHLDVIQDAELERLETDCAAEYRITAVMRSDYSTSEPEPTTFGPFRSLEQVARWIASLRRVGIDPTVQAVEYSPAVRAWTPVEDWREKVWADA